MDKQNDTPARGVGMEGEVKQTQTVKQMPIPLTGASWGVLQLPFPMTPENWEELEDFLKLMKGPLTGTRKQATVKEQPEH